ncbi:hypothetical protein SDRG_09219 [Saprolegnia diclina VS20]|uniref:ubiquitinyl hydrolase 1 n=1 Tax=Saprolegnia diclina (strain VS20) TaxID=1156394 RepID=T0QEQ9_SAPDV|nr:hypothetical protein SDRG_09219 [Saprolegnia diclina VS20]EQC33236.1 hypothetical protein SDRG_09219 [Saprolegnia diclina VS20]|eukprot:XP_008613359.1 hypothetical protein SDRG_09219 [Saprolegnia diclina VS20]
MGAASSIDDGAPDLEPYDRLREGFRRLLPPGAPRGHGIDRATFRYMVLASFPRFPRTLAERIFDVLNVEHSGLLQLSELLAGLELSRDVPSSDAKLQQAYREKQCKLLFAIYDYNDTGLLQRDVLERFVIVIYGAAKLPLVAPALDVLFDKATLSQAPFLTYAEFHRHFETRNASLEFLFRWLATVAMHVGRGPDPGIGALQTAYSVVAIRDRIRADTLLTIEEICNLEKWFQRALTSGQRLATDAFVQSTFAASTSPRFAEALARFIGPRLDFHQFCLLVSTFARSSTDDALRYLFRIVADPRLTHATLVELVEHPMHDNATSSHSADDNVRADSDDADGYTLEAFVELATSSSSRSLVEPLLHALAIAVSSQFNYSVKPQTPAIERCIVRARWLDYTIPQRLHIWHLVDTAWWCAWCKYSGFHVLEGTRGGSLPFPALPASVVQTTGLDVCDDDASTTERPPRLNNWALQLRAGSRRLQPNMVLGQHFHLLPEPVYTALVAWFGGGPPFARSYVVGDDGHLTLELFPLVLRVAKTTYRGDITLSGEEILVGAHSTTASMLYDCCHALVVLRDAVSKSRLWAFRQDQPLAKVLLPPNALPYAQLSQEWVLLVEVQDSDGSWPLSQPEGSLDETAPESHPPSSDAPKSYSNGLVGLDNLGNTCYMSSAIQCLSHSRLLSDYFRTGLYRHDINTRNPLGMQGRLAAAFGQLVLQLWTTSKKHLSPSPFKAVLAKYNSHFDNDDQHDAQELLAFLLSGLSEDLNRVVEPPPSTPIADSHGRRDADVADEWWQTFLQREVSVIVALFMGQYKSLLTCSRCHFASASFEPFTFLQLPLPESTLRHLVLTIVFRCDRPPLRVTVPIQRSGTIADVKQAVLALDVVETAHLIAACLQGRDGVVHTVFAAGHSVSHIRDDEPLIVYEVDDVTALQQQATCDPTAPLRVGDAVGVPSDRGGTPSHARITHCNANGTYDIAYWTGKRDSGLSRTRVLQYAGKSVHVYLVHRRMEHSNVFLTDPCVLRLFGTPLVLPFVPSATTGYALYVAVWQRLRRIFHWTELPVPLKTARAPSARSNVATVALGRGLEDTGFGFCLRMVTTDGLACSRCDWLDGCRGCLVPSDDVAFVQMCGRETLAIDWDMATMTEVYDGGEASKVVVHPSYHTYKAVVDAPLSLASCLLEFTACEPMDEAFCGRCKALSPSTKKMDLWRLPPLLVIQLKRFQYTSSSKKKLRQLVHFPLRGLDLADFLVKKTLTPGLEHWQFLGGKLATQHEARPNSVYDLYAVINHMGALGAGHYVANVRSESDQKWRCFNDHLCRDIDERDVVSSSAYILFYARRDMQSLPVRQVFPPNMSASPLSDDELSAMLSDRDGSRCTIS